jgi:hypothetical protein
MTDNGFCLHFQYFFQGSVTRSNLSLQIYGNNASLYAVQYVAVIGHLFFELSAISPQLSALPFMIAGACCQLFF